MMDNPTFQGFVTGFIGITVSASKITGIILNGGTFLLVVGMRACVGWYTDRNSEADRQREERQSAYMRQFGIGMLAGTAAGALRPLIQYVGEQINYSLSS